jgi:hypothetical protein
VFSTKSSLVFDLSVESGDKEVESGTGTHKEEVSIFWISIKKLQDVLETAYNNYHNYHLQSFVLLIHTARQVS